MLLRPSLGLVGLTVILISGCSPASNKAIESLQTKILEDVVSKGGNSLKSVICPADQSKAESFTCTGILESGNGFDIPVKSEAGENHAWEIVSIKGLLNMSQIQAAIQSGLTTELGNATIDCGTTTPYKAAKPGEQFECQVTGTKPATTPDPKATDPKTAKDPQAPEPATKAAKAADPKAKAAKPEKVMVTIALSGDISWQRVLPVGKANPSNTQDSSAAPKDTAIDKPTTSGTSNKTALDTPSADGKSANSQTPSGDAAPATAPAANGEDAINTGAFDAAED
jgi:hypothetical protein